MATIQHSAIAEANLHETKGVSTAVTGTFLKANAGVGIWGYQQYNLDVDIASLNTGTAYYITAPFASTILKIWSVIDGAIGTADTTITASIGGVSVTNGVITIAFTASAAGDVDSCTPTALNAVAAGVAIKFTVSGTSTGASRCHLNVILNRTV
jgi:hypothetical protein